jgi:nitronate monooxygenase
MGWMNYPRIIQGGMGVAVSSTQLANAVARRGQMGVVSGTALDTVLARRLQLGDLAGDFAEAFAHFPIKDMAARVWERYFVPGGKDPAAPFKSKPVGNVVPSQGLLDLLIMGAFVEVWLAKRGHSGQIGINLLEKIQLPTLPTLYGAMLAGVDVVLMGAGIPRTVPAVLSKLAEGEEVEINIEIPGDAEGVVTKFDPKRFWVGPLKRPKFLAIVSSASIAHVLAKKCTPPADGFIIEGPKAGGHNAPPRGKMELNEKGEPIYGERDKPDFDKYRELGLPFWMAGSYGTHEMLLQALEEGAEGIQVGTAFAYCEESGIIPQIKHDVIKKAQAGKIEVFTDPRCSPTGFPFKVVPMEGTMSEPKEIKDRCRICDLGYLRSVYRTPEGKVGYRCAAEPIDDYIKKGGEEPDVHGRKCVCNGLLSTIGLAQIRGDYVEPPLLTAGDDLADIGRFLKPGASSYTADDVIDALLGVDLPTKIEVELPVAERV